MTSPNAYDRRMRSVARPIARRAAADARRLAREHDCLVGGGFIAVRGNDTRGTYALCEPDGAIHLHDKDQPSFWENNYYAGGSDDGFAHDIARPDRLANGFEWGRVRTAKRLAGRVQLLAGGMHFPSFPTWALTKPWFITRDEEFLHQYCRETPPRMARMLGVPAVHPSHVGAVHDGDAAGARADVAVADARRDHDLRRRRRGRCSGCPTTTARATSPPMSTWPTRVPRDPIPDLFWNAPFPISVHLVWYVGQRARRREVQGDEGAAASTHGSPDRTSRSTRRRRPHRRWGVPLAHDRHAPARRGAAALAGGCAGQRARGAAGRAGRRGR